MILSIDELENIYIAAKANYAKDAKIEITTYGNGSVYVELNGKEVYHKKTKNYENNEH